MSPDPSVRVRRAEPADVPGLVASIDALIQEDAGRHDGWANRDWAAEHAEQMFTDAVGDPSRLVLVVDDGQVSGHLRARVADAADFRTVRTATIASLYVAPHLRDRGLGGELVQRFLAWADDVDAPHADVSAYAANAAAIRFYASHGFEPLNTLLRRTGAGRP